MLGTRHSGICLYCLLIFLLLLTALPAEGSDSRASKCVVVSDDAKRLQCYDSAFERVTGNDEVPAYEERLIAEEREQHE